MLFSFFAIVFFPQYTVISCRLKMHNTFDEQIIILRYTIVIVLDLILSLMVVRFYDKMKFEVLFLVTNVMFLPPIFAFQNSKFLAALGIVLYSFITAFYQSVTRAAILVIFWVVSL